MGRAAPSPKICADSGPPSCRSLESAQGIVALARRAPTPPGIFVLHDGMGLVANRSTTSLIPIRRGCGASRTTALCARQATAEEANIIGPHPVVRLGDLRIMDGTP